MDYRETGVVHLLPGVMSCAQGHLADPGCLAWHLDKVIEWVYNQSAVIARSAFEAPRQSTLFQKGVAYRGNRRFAREW